MTENIQTRKYLTKERDREKAQFLEQGDWRRFRAREDEAPLLKKQG